MDEQLELLWLKFSLKKLILAYENKWYETRLHLLMGSLVIMLVFENSGDKDRVYDRQPWSIYKALILFK